MKKFEEIEIQLLIEIELRKMFLQYKKDKVYLKDDFDKMIVSNSKNILKIFKEVDKEN